MIHTVFPDWVWYGIIFTLVAAYLGAGVYMFREDFMLKTPKKKSAMNVLEEELIALEHRIKTLERIHMDDQRQLKDHFNKLDETTVPVRYTEDTDRAKRDAAVINRQADRIKDLEHQVRNMRDANQGLTASVATLRSQINKIRSLTD